MAVGRNVVVYTDTGSFTLLVGESFTIPYGTTTTINIKQSGIDNLVLKSGTNLFTILPNNTNNVFNIENLSRDLVIYNNNGLTIVNLSVLNSTTVPIEIWKDSVLFQTINVGQNGTYSVVIGSLIEIRSTTPYRISSANYNSNNGSGYSTIIAGDTSLSVQKAIFNISVQNNADIDVLLYVPNQIPQALVSGGNKNFQLYYGDLLEIGSISPFRVGTTDYLPPTKYQLTIVYNVTLTVLNPTPVYVETGYWNIGYTV